MSACTCAETFMGNCDFCILDKLLTEAEARIKTLEEAAVLNGETFGSHAYKRLLANNNNWGRIARNLWGLLDNIDTASDMFKDNYQGLADYVYLEQQKRHVFMTSDGHKLFPKKDES